MCDSLYQGQGHVQDNVDVRQALIQAQDDAKALKATLKSQKAQLNRVNPGLNQARQDCKNLQS